MQDTAAELRASTHSVHQLMLQWGRNSGAEVTLQLCTNDDPQFLCRMVVHNCCAASQLQHVTRLQTCKIVCKMFTVHAILCAVQQQCSNSAEMDLQCERAELMCRIDVQK